MKIKEIAVLITCHNRKSKTITCLNSLFEAEVPSDYHLDVYLMDDGSVDGTVEAVKVLFPTVSVWQGNGNLYWARGMHLIWERAMKEKIYDAFLLINDDVRLYHYFLINLLKTDEYSLSHNGCSGVYSGATIDKNSHKITYGGLKIKTNHLIVRLKQLVPAEYPQSCEITNANILWISKMTVDTIGIFDKRFIHGIADFDYALRARKKNIPVYLSPYVCGECTNDHPTNWKEGKSSLRERILYLKSPKGLAYNEYLYYIRKHFPFYLPYSFIMLWMKTFFPVLWHRFK